MDISNKIGDFFFEGVLKLHTLKSGNYKDEMIASKRLIVSGVVAMGIIALGCLSIGVITLL